MAGTFVHRVAVGQLIRLNRFSTFLYVPTHSTATEVDVCIVRLVHLLTFMHSQYVLIELHILKTLDLRPQSVSLVTSEQTCARPHGNQ